MITMTEAEQFLADKETEYYKGDYEAAMYSFIPRSVTAKWMEEFLEFKLNKKSYERTSDTNRRRPGICS